MRFELDRSKQPPQVDQAATAPILQSMWKELWRTLAHRDSGEQRPVPNEAEGMLVRLKQLEESGTNPEATEILRYNLSTFASDVSFLERTRDFQNLAWSDQSRVLDVWFGFRSSAHGWKDLVAAVRESRAAPVLAPLVLRELNDNQAQFLGELAGQADDSVRLHARRIVTYLGGAFSHLHGDAAKILPDAARMLFVSGGLNPAEYAQKLCCYAKSPGATLDECANQLLRAREVLPTQLPRETETDLFQLGSMLGATLKGMSSKECLRFLEAPAPIVLGLAQSFIAKHVAEFPSPNAITAIEQVSYQLAFASSVLHPTTVARAASGVTAELLTALEKLPASDALAMLEIVSPLIIKSSWWSRESQELWNMLSCGKDPSRLPVQVGLLRCILESSVMTGNLSDWVATQVGHACFRDRLDFIVALSKSILRDRLDGGERAVSEAQCLGALRLLAELGPSASRAIPEVAALLGYPVIQVWGYGPMFLPYRVERDTSAQVLEAGRYVLHVTANWVRASFQDALRRKGI